MNSSFQYLKLVWDHDFDDEPNIIFYEVQLDQDRLCRRSIEVFASGKIKCLDDLYYQAIEITPIPTIDEINQGIWGDDLLAYHCCAKEFEDLFAQGTLALKKEEH